MSKEYTRRQTIIGNIPSHGPILLWSDFSNNFAWSPTGATGKVIERSIRHILSGSASLHIATKTGGAYPNNDAGYMVKFAHTISDKIEFETAFLTEDETLIHFVDFELDIYTGTNLLKYKIRWDYAAAKWKYYDADGNYSDIPGGSIDIVSDVWNRLTWSIDINAVTYLDFIGNNVAVDMSALTPQIAANGSAPQIILQTQVYNEESDIAEIWVDSILVTEI